MANRYCGNCGQELKPEDQFCTGCGSSVHATTRVSTPEADVPVPPLPRQDIGSPQPSGSGQPAPPQSQQRPVGLWQQFKRPLLWFLGSVVVAGLLGASMAPRILYFASGFTIYAFDQMLIRLILFAPLWLFLGGVFYLFARPLGKNPSLLQVVFNRQLTIVMVVLVLLSGLSYF